MPFLPPNCMVHDCLFIYIAYVACYYCIKQQTIHQVIWWFKCAMDLCQNGLQAWTRIQLPVIQKLQCKHLEKVRPWCGQSLNQGRLKNRTEPACCIKCNSPTITGQCANQHIDLLTVPCCGHLCGTRMKSIIILSPNKSFSQRINCNHHQNSNGSDENNKCH